MLVICSQASPCPSPPIEILVFEWTSVSITLLACTVLLAALQILLIAGLLKRNRIRRLAQPLSPRAFRAELERILRQADPTP